MTYSDIVGFLCCRVAWLSYCSLAWELHSRIQSRRKQLIDSHLRNGMGNTISIGTSAPGRRTSDASCPLTGSTTWVEYNGTDVVRKIWEGANSGVVEADGPSGHLEIFTLRLYNPQAHQWSISFTNPSTGTMSIPSVGEFKDGRGEFYDQETFNGRTILLRFNVSDITSTSCRFEQAFSDNGGRTWETNFIVTETRVKDEPHTAQ